MSLSQMHFCGGLVRYWEMVRRGRWRWVRGISPALAPSYPWGVCLEYILGQTEELPAYSRTKYMEWIPRGRNILEWLELSYVSITAIIFGTQYGKGSYIRQGLIDFEAHHRLLEFCPGMLEAAL
jgi:hypothetical protein